MPTPNIRPWGQGGAEPLPGSFGYRSPFAELIIEAMGRTLPFNAQAEVARLNRELAAIKADVAELRAAQAQRDSLILTGPEVAREFAGLANVPPEFMPKEAIK